MTSIQRNAARLHASQTSIDARPIFDGSNTDGSDTAGEAPSSYFGNLSLTWNALAAQLDSETSAALADFAHGKRKLTKEQANRTAECVMRWALKHGATHYAHWFHPLTNVPADKHDAFLARGIIASHVSIEQLPGSLLMQGEPDASSFPSGGLRSTHEARGYTVWDPTSALFIRDDGGTRTLCIPCVFLSWKGHALDFKTPLLRALDALNREATQFFNLLSGDDNTSGVFATLGTEQEYFLIDKSFLVGRPDILATGRSLVGAPPARGQQLEDHYFGPIPARVQAYISEVERELYRIGVPVKTRHCEVAPAQFETAPVFEEINVACDHNVLTMDVLRRVADRHGLVCLLHEKPFAGINGSGKHNNWSLATPEGENLLEPGSKPAENLRFLATLAAILRTMHLYNDVIRASIASAGNDHRLGANEAPPAIISVYLGNALDHIVEAVAAGKVPDIQALPDLIATSHLSARRELTDRNRTTPFAFTGNKFEFRAVGSSENCAWPMTILNAGIASTFRHLRERLTQKLAKSNNRNTAALELVREIFNETKAVRFEGNNYEPAWVEEAKRRGLPVNQNTTTAIAPLANPERTGFLVEQGVLSREEIHSRYEILGERYVKIIDIEANVLADIALTQVVPTVEDQLVRTSAAARALTDNGLSGSHEVARLKTLASHLEGLYKSTQDLQTARHSLHGGAIADGMFVAIDRVIPAMQSVRQHIDALEMVVADELWPLPKYREMLFQGV